jgi:hypothetical protein
VQLEEKTIGILQRMKKTTSNRKDEGMMMDTKKDAKHR